jgi:hypothetical protein
LFKSKKNKKVVQELKQPFEIVGRAQQDRGVCGSSLSTEQVV